MPSAFEDIIVKNKIIGVIGKHSRVLVQDWARSYGYTLRNPWSAVIFKKVGYVTKVNKREGLALVEWMSDHEAHWFALDELELWSPQREFKFKIGDKITVSEHVQEEADLHFEPNAHGVGEIKFINPNSWNPYLVQFSETGKVFEYQEPELILAKEVNTCGQ